MIVTFIHLYLKLFLTATTNMSSEGYFTLHQKEERLIYPLLRGLSTIAQRGYQFLLDFESEEYVFFVVADQLSTISMMFLFRISYLSK